MKIKIKVFLTILCLSALFALAGTDQARAIEYGMLGGKPANPDPNVENSASWFIYKLNPGEAKEDLLEVNNLFSESWKALIYAADTTPSSSGGFALKQFSEPKLEVGSWVSFYPAPLPEFFQGLFKRKDKKILEVCRLSREEIQDEFDVQNKKVKIKPKVEETQFQELEKWCAGVESVEKEMASKEKLFIPFVIRVPKEVDVGEHTGGVLIQKVEPETQKEETGSAIKLTTRVGVRIYETVPGEIIKKLTLGDFKVIKNFKEFSFADWFGDPKRPQEYLVQSSVKNDGNVSIEQENIIHVKDLLFGKRSEDVSRKFQVLKKDSFISNYSWHNPRFGRFSFATEMKYEDAGGQEVAVVGPEIKIWVIPWREMAIASVLFLLAFAAYEAWRLYHKKKYGGIGWVPYAVQKGEDVVGLALQNNVNWKVLVKVNKLKAPYSLETGRTILIPPLDGVSPINEAMLEKKVENLLIEKEPEDILPAEEAPIEEAVQKVIEKEKIENEGKKIKAEPVKKEEIYGEKTGPAGEEPAQKKKSKEEFIAKLARREVSEEKEEIVEEKSFLWKKLGWIIPGAIFLAIAIWGVVAFLGKNGKEEIVIQEKIPPISIGNNSEDANKNQAAEEEKNTADQNASLGNNDTKAKISLIVLNGGASEGAAGKIKDILVSGGYSKAEAKNALASDHSGAAVYYKDDSLKETAEAIKEVISGQKIAALVKKAATMEQKSADVVVMLGK